MDVNEIIKVGMKNEVKFPVEEQYTAAHVGSGSLRVLATPSMIAFMERLACDLLQQHLPEGYSSVGMLVDVRHLAPTPAGGMIRVECEVLEVDRWRVTFAVQAWDALEKVGEGRHQRAVIEVGRFLGRVEEKRDKLGIAI
jgi:predicted thioesterase